MIEDKTGFLICDICGKEKAHVVKRPQILGRGSRMKVIDNVPIISCRNCGEAYMTSATMHRLDNIRVTQKEKESERKITVAEFV